MCNLFKRICTWWKNSDIGLLDTLTCLLMLQLSALTIVVAIKLYTPVVTVLACIAIFTVTLLCLIEVLRKKRKE